MPPPHQTWVSPYLAKGEALRAARVPGTSGFSATSSNSNSISYSLDAASLAAGNTINSATGTVTFVASWINNSTITASATGCNGPASATHVVSSNGNGTPTFFIGTASSRNQGAGTVTYTAIANNGGSVSYSLDAASLAAGNTINSATGTVIYSDSWSGTTLVTASSSGCVGVVSSVHTVTVYSSSVFKHLYLSDPAQALDRIDPVATADLTTATTAVISNGGSVTFTEAPALCSQLIIKIGNNITVTNYITVTSGTMPANPAITATLSYGGNNIITLTNPVYNSGTGLLTWTGALLSDATVPAGQAIQLVISSAQAGCKLYHSIRQPGQTI